MTPQEAIENLQESIVAETNRVLISDGGKKDKKRNIAALQIAISALKKQTQKAIKNISDDGIERYFCDCGNIMHRKQKYCDICGQALDWSENNG